MDSKHSLDNTQLGKNEHRLSMSFKIVLGVLAAIIAGYILFLIFYQPEPPVAQPEITFDQKMTYLESGKVPSGSQNAPPKVPRWMISMIFSFIVIQIIPLVLAAQKARTNQLTRRDLRQIEFLTETPLHLGLLGSLLGVCMTHFLSGTLSAPLAYLTTISGILLYLLGRFTIQVNLPSWKEVK